MRNFLYLKTLISLQLRKTQREEIIIHVADLVDTPLYDICKCSSHHSNIVLHLISIEMRMH